MSTVWCLKCFPEETHFASCNLNIFQSHINVYFKHSVSVLCLFEKEVEKEFKCAMPLGSRIYKELTIFMHVMFLEKYKNY